MFALDHASLRQEKDLVWLGMAPIGIAWVFQAQILAPTPRGYIDQLTHLGCEIVGYTDLVDGVMPVPHLRSSKDEPLFLRRVFYLSPDWDHTTFPEDLPDDIVVTAESIKPGWIGTMPWDFMGLSDFEDDDYDD